MNAEALAQQLLDTYRRERACCEVEISPGVLLKAIPRRYGAATRFVPGKGWVDCGLLALTVFVAGRRFNNDMPPNWKDEEFLEGAIAAITWARNTARAFIAAQLAGDEWHTWDDETKPINQGCVERDFIPNRFLIPDIDMEAVQRKRYRRRL